MSRVVLVFSGPGEIPECDLQAIRRHAGVTVIDHRRSNALLLEVDGSASEFLADEPGEPLRAPAHGRVVAYDMDGHIVQDFDDQVPLNAPWGMALAPDNFGALSGNAILALNRGAKMGGFAHDTGEGSISRYHREPGGDLVWEIGSGYFGARKPDGSFSDERFAENA